MAYSGEGVLMYGVDVDGTAIPIEATPVALGATTRGSFSINTPFGFRSDTYTGIAPGDTVTIPSGVKSFSISVKGTGGIPTLWNVVLEISLDNVNFTPVLIHNTPDGDGNVIATTNALWPAVFFRSRCRNLTLGPASDIVVRILGMD